MELCQLEKTEDRILRLQWKRAEMSLNAAEAMNAESISFKSFTTREGNRLIIRLKDDVQDKPSISIVALSNSVKINLDV